MAAAPLYTTVHHLPDRDPTAAELQDILRGTCGPPPPVALLEGRAGLFGTLILWKPLLHQPPPKPQSGHPLAVLAAAYLAGLQALIAEVEEAGLSPRRAAAYRTMIETEITAVLARQQTWPFIPGDPAPTPYWHGAARAISINIAAAYEEAELPAPSRNHRADAIAVILGSLGFEVEVNSVRKALTGIP
jgi:hypothetical protein